jgi:hypothetical protein
LQVEVTNTHKNAQNAECRWLTPIILATQEAEIRRILVRSQPGQIVCEILPSKKKSSQKKRLVEWLKVKTLSSNVQTSVPHTQTQKKNSKKI